MRHAGLLPQPAACAVLTCGPKISAALGRWDLLNASAAVWTFRSSQRMGKLAKKKSARSARPQSEHGGIREKSVYGNETAESINAQIADRAEKMDYACEIFQSNWEWALVDKIHEARGNFDGVILNGGALSHYSYARGDAIAAVRIPFVEVHMSNIYAREEFRHHSGPLGRVRRADLRLRQECLFPGA